jgi:hypothetical protein
MITTCTRATVAPTGTTILRDDEPLDDHSTIQSTIHARIHSTVLRDDDLR